MRYETLEDRALQASVKKRLEWLLIEINKWPITIRETPWSKAESHDYEFVREDHCVMGVAEVKCRRGDYNERYFKKEGWLLEGRRMASLRSAWADVGAFVMFVLLTSDKKIYVISLKKLDENAAKLESAGAVMFKDDHGKRDSGKTSGVIVPLDLMTYIGEAYG